MLPFSTRRTPRGFGLERDICHWQFVHNLNSCFGLCVILGLDDLVDMERRFEPYKKTLFSLESLNLDRELQSRELNDKLNISIANFLQLLCSYVLHTPAHQTLEYLIRRYKSAPILFSTYYRSSIGVIMHLSWGSGFKD